MQQTLNAPPTPISRVPGEIISLILSHTMRSSVPFDLEHFLRRGRDLRKHGEGNQHGESSEDWFLDGLDPGQREHFRDWVLINSTCRGFRAWGKEAFFSEKIFVIRPLFMKAIARDGADGAVSSAIMATARAAIRHVVAPFPAIYLVTLPRYNALERLRSLTVGILHRRLDHLLSTSDLARLEPVSLPEEYLNRLRDLGLGANQLTANLLIDKEACPAQMERRVHIIYAYVRLQLVRKARREISRRGIDPRLRACPTGAGFSLVLDTSFHLASMFGTFTSLCMMDV